MKLYKVTITDIEKAIQKTNKRFKGNVEIHSLYRHKNYLNLRLCVKDMEGKGTKFGFPNERQKFISKTNFKIVKYQFRTRFACWHVHGTFFDNLFSIKPDAYLYSNGKKITKHEGNWINIFIAHNHFGDIYSSSLCKCEKYI